MSVAAVALIVALAVAWSPSGARADGDPASDVLVFRSVFLPKELSYGRRYELLTDLLAESKRAGFPIRVALIDSPADLGTVTSLWLKPKAYSAYLQFELSLAFRGQVAVVMPDGIYINPGEVAPTAAEERVASELPAPGSGNALLTGAITAVQRLAAAEGHPLPVAGIRVPSTPSGGSGGAAEWLALVLGALLIALAWAASLRARPLTGRRRATA